ncbi:MBL fold metallo-hydrolase [soil metagenome]
MQNSVTSNTRIRFLGGAGTVTGSKYLLTSGEKNILIDCGLFQGLKELRLKNWDRFPIDPKTIEAVVLTHAHIDHSGYVPRLIKEGFTGKIYCTHATMELCRILLPDTGYIQEEEAQWLSRKKLSKHQTPLPLFSKDEAEKSLEQFVPKNFDEPFEVIPGFRASFKYAGHILGAAMVIIETPSTKIAFSGDLGRPNDSILYPPVDLPQVDYLVVESTYGNRKHEVTDPEADLEAIVNLALKKNGVVLIPAFAVGRAQALMHSLSDLKKENRIPNVPMYLNSPMAINVTELYKHFKSLHRLSDAECDEMSKSVHYVRSTEESKALNEKKGPMVIVSASGMATGGRIVHHLKAFVSNPTTTVALAGYQAAGTRGRALEDGAKEIKIHGEFIPVRATIKSLENVSAHADYSEILEWLAKSNLKSKPKKVFVTHGEAEAAQSMKEHITKRFDWLCEVPRQDQEFKLE